MATDLRRIRLTHRLYVGRFVSREEQVTRAIKLTANGNPNENYVMLHDHSSETTCPPDGCKIYPEELDAGSVIVLR